MTNRDPYLLLTTTPDTNRPAQLEGFHRVENETRRPIGRFGRVGPINVFVGPNNAGKSRILRQMFTRQFLALDCEDEVVERLVRLNAVLEAWPAARTYFPEVAEFLPLLFTDPIRLRPGQQRPQQNLLKYSDAPGRLEVMPLAPQLGEGRGQTPADRQAYQQLMGFTDPIAIDLAIGDQLTRVFIPTLRSTIRIADSMGQSSKDFDSDPLQRAFVDAYGIGRMRYDGKNERLRIHAGGRAYEEIDAHDRGSQDKRDLLQDFQAFLSHEFFADAELRLVPRKDGELTDVNGQKSPQVVLEVSTRKSSFPIQDLGDGVSALIVLLMPIFLQPRGSWIFVEEPENHLHPGLQRRFMEVAHQYGVVEREHRLFLTTHSNHVLEAAREIPATRIFRVERTVSPADGVAREHTVTEVPRECVDVLDDLGVSAASVLQARCVLWVEGPTDVHYIRGLLRLALEEAKGLQVVEGRDFAFVCYGGSLLRTVEDDQDADAVHQGLGRIRAVGLKSLVIADRDGPEKAEQHDRRAKEFPSKNVTYLVTSGLEVENDLGARVWLKLFPRVKPKVWVSPVELDDNALKGSNRLGTIADDLFGGSRARKSGTLDDDAKTAAANVFARLVREKEITWETLSSPGKRLGTAVLEFIRASVPTNPAL